MDQETKKGLTRPMDMAVTIVKEYIDNHPLDWKSIDDFSLLTSVNRKRLQQAFKSKYGNTISDYQLAKRMECAAEMLREAACLLNKLHPSAAILILIIFAGRLKKFSNTPQGNGKTHVPFSWTIRTPKRTDRTPKWTNCIHF
jgi:AraC-like DNA-binding protein